MSTSEVIAPIETGRLNRRSQRMRVPDGVWSVAGVILSLAFLAPLLAIAGVSISEGYKTLFTASFGSTANVGFLLLSSIPLLLVGLGVALPLRAGLFNLGGEGQLLAGALAGAWVALHLGIASQGGGSYIVSLAAGGVAGAVVGGAAGVLKARRHVSEVVTTLMLSFIVILLGQWLVSGPMEAPNAVYPATETIPAGAQLRTIGANGLIPVGFIVAVIVAVITWLGTEFTRLGWRQRLMGLNPRVAARQGVNLGREAIIALGLGGALAGVGGAAELLGNQMRVGYVFSPGWGWDAIVIALLARGSALGVIPFALYFGFLRNGALVLQQDLQVSSDLVLVMGGAPVILVAAVIGWRSYRRFLSPAE